MDDRFTIEFPKQSQWQATLVRGLSYRPEEGAEPNWFHRFMQRLCFGIVWEKADG